MRYESGDSGIPRVPRMPSKVRIQLMDDDGEVMREVVGSVEAFEQVDTTRGARLNLVVYYDPNPSDGGE